MNKDKYDRIKEIIVNNHKYYICYKDNFEAIYDEDFNLRVSEDEKLYDLVILKTIKDIDKLYITAKKENKYGIVSSSKNESNINIEYDFGACDIIIDLDEDKTLLIKKSNGYNKIGYFKHKNIDMIIPPVYKTFIYYNYPIEYSIPLININGVDTKPDYIKTDHIEKDMLLTYLELILYSKVRKNKEIYGLLQKTKDENGNIKLTEIFKMNYSNISYDISHNLFYLKDSNTSKCGITKINIKWNYTFNGNKLEGYPFIEKSFEIPTIYDSVVFDEENNRFICSKDNQITFISNFNEKENDIIKLKLN